MQRPRSFKRIIVLKWATAWVLIMETRSHSAIKRKVWMLHLCYSVIDILQQASFTFAATQDTLKFAKGEYLELIMTFSSSKAELTSPRIDRNFQMWKFPSQIHDCIQTHLLRGILFLNS